MYCSKGFKSTKLQGDYYSNEFNYVKFGYRPCAEMPSKAKDAKLPENKRTKFLDDIEPDWYIKPKRCDSKRK